MKYEQVNVVDAWKKRLNAVFRNTDICDEDREVLEEYFAKIFREISEVALFMYDNKDKYATIVGGVNLKKSMLDVTTILMNLYLGLYQVKVKSMRDYNELIKTMLYGYDDIAKYKILIDEENLYYGTWGSWSNDDPIEIKDENCAE